MENSRCTYAGETGGLLTPVLLRSITFFVAAATSRSHAALPICSAPRAQGPGSGLYPRVHLSLMAILRLFCRTCLGHCSHSAPFGDAFRAVAHNCSPGRRLGWSHWRSAQFFHPSSPVGFSCHREPGVSAAEAGCSDLCQAARCRPKRCWYCCCRAPPPRHWCQLQAMAHRRMAELSFSGTRQHRADKTP
jgi:hypothetical protein